MDTFLKDGNRGMVDALKKMPVRGKLWFSGQAAYDVTYIRELPTPTGRKIRLVTNRFVTLADISGNAQQAQDYSLSALELDLSTEKGKSTGVFPGLRILDGEGERDQDRGIPKPLAPGRNHGKEEQVRSAD